MKQNKIVRNALITLVIASMFILSLLPGVLNASVQNNGTMSEPIPTPNYIIGPDLIVSFDEEATSNDALHPATAIAPSGAPNEESIHVVWDEVNEFSSGLREIMYSMSEDGGMTWNHDHDDFVISPNLKSNNGNAVNPSIAIDRFGIIHVVWSEQIQTDGTWEIMYSRSTNNGKDWTGFDQEIPVSHRLGNEGDAQTISTPKIYAAPSDKWGVMLYVVWSEFTEKDGSSIHISKSYNGGVTWSGMENDIAYIPGEFMSYNPVLAVSGKDGQEVHISWSQKSLQYELEEIYYIMNYDYGNIGRWLGEAKAISFPANDDMAVGRLSMSIDEKNWLHVIWSQRNIKEPTFSEIYYSGSDNLGQTWTGVGKDMVISKFDGHPASKPTVSTSPDRVQVAWTELDESSPKGTIEIHTSWSEQPFNSESWTGLKDDIVVSHGDTWGPANAQNATMVLGSYRGIWSPTYVWDELNDEPTFFNNLLAPDQNNEIHTNPPEWTLDIDVFGSGSVSIDPDQSTYANGVSVLLTAYPIAGWSFAYWGGNLSGSTNPITIIMDYDKYVTATFTQDQYTLTLNIYGTGSVSKSPLQATYTYGQVVTLTATPVFGWRFDHWSGSLAGSANPTLITMTSSKVVNAYFYQNINYVNLTSGWNLVSLPLIQSNTAITSVLSSITGSYDSVKYFNAQDKADPWKTYRVGRSGNDLTNIDHTMAVWIKTIRPCTLSIYGNIPTSTSISLYAGWNFVGYPTQDTNQLVSTALAGTGYDRVEGFQSASPYLKVLTGVDKMVPGQGYWVHVPANTVWTINW